jgi:protein-disulfide isomerase
MRFPRCVSALVFCLLAVPAFAQDPGITRQQADEILKELRQIRQLLERGTQAAPAEPTPVHARFSIEGRPMLGRKDAPITIVEFTDYQCTFCQRFHLVTFPEIRKKYIDSGKVRFVSRDFPLDFHSNALRAAESARCAGDQGLYWEMRDTLVANATKLSPDDILGFARAIKLRIPEFQSCLDKGTHRDAIRQDSAQAAALQVNGTPSFIVGKSTPDGVDGELVVGALPIAAFDAKIAEIQNRP